jgi:hypothetical protein
MGEDGRPVRMIDVFIELQARRGLAQHGSQCGLADFQRLSPEVVA